MTSARSAPTPAFSLGGGLPVRRLGFGTMRLADDFASVHPAPVWSPPSDRRRALAVLRRAVELGVQLVDTADAYALGGGEEMVAEALHPYGDDLLIATKIGTVRPSPDEWVLFGHPDYLRQQAELSLRRLRLDCLPLLQLHRIDPKVPLADQIGALKRLRDEGKVRHIGLSEVTVRQIEQASAIVPIAAVQNEYNLAARRHDEVVAYCERQGIAFLSYFPIAVGALSRAGGALRKVADAVGATPAQVALAWLLHRSPNVLPIPGTSSVAHLEENMAAAEVVLDDEHIALLSAPDFRG
ncbi:aldo/keto reductase [Streptomyces polygonati]|uniref:Aldo/keto reductase n=1 Tax=Streptomyces polygonati TaxID=1617087 RepID=A0ABV8HFQ8_9ACTN